MSGAQHSFVQVGFAMTAVYYTTMPTYIVVILSAGALIIATTHYRRRKLQSVNDDIELNTSKNVQALYTSSPSNRDETLEIRRAATFANSCSSRRGGVTDRNDGRNKSSKSNKTETESKKNKGFRRNKEENVKKRRGRHYRHGKQSKFKKIVKNANEVKKNKNLKKDKIYHNRSVSVSETLKQLESRESFGSSNRSRSASPLPSIHRLPPSSTELDPPKPQNSDVLKEYENYGRRQEDAKAAWESLFDCRRKTVHKTKQNLNIFNKYKNQKLRETIEKLRAKSENYKDSSLLHSLVASNCHNAGNLSYMSIKKFEYDQSGDLDLCEYKSCSNKKKKYDNNENINCTAKNESASEALEQAVKDITKWLDDVPKSSAESSACDSFAYIITTEGHDNSRQDEEFSQIERSLQARKYLTRKKLLSREPKMFAKRRDLHRTRLQPGKSKGNLLTITFNKNAVSAEVPLPDAIFKVERKDGKCGETSPKLSLGSVLQTVEFSFGKDDKFINNEHKPEEPKETPNKSSEVANYFGEVDLKKKYNVHRLNPSKKDANILTDPITSVQLSQESALPNLSAWFKAFGSPKSTISVTTVNKKKPEESRSGNKPAGKKFNENISFSPKISAKYDSFTEPEVRNPDESNSPLRNITTTPRQRRTSTGSSISERSSFSQDFDSPHHPLSLTSPLLQSPTSSHIDDIQIISYPAMNGTIRAGFYQDTTCIKSSPEKSCSPGTVPQSAFSPYLQHKYAPNNAPTINNLKEHKKIPLSTYIVNPPMYHDTTKALAADDPDHTHEENIYLGPDSYQHYECSAYSVPNSPHLQSKTTNQYSHAQNSPLTATSESISLIIKMNANNKKNVTPVKKRLCNKKDLFDIKIAQESIETSRYDYHTSFPSLYTTPLQVTSVYETKSESKEKFETGELKSLFENSRECKYRNTFDNSKNLGYEVIAPDIMKLPDVDANQAVSIAKKDYVDMNNLGYMSLDNYRRNNKKNTDTHKQTHSLQTERYEEGFFAINLGIINKQIQKSIPKSNILCHANDRSTCESLNMTHTRHSQYESICSIQSSNFSLSELTNKTIYGYNSVQSPTVQDNVCWKTGHQTRKQDVLHSYNINTDKFRSDKTNSVNTSAINYDNKSIHDQLSNNFKDSKKTSSQRSRDEPNLQSELKIQTSRGLVQNDVNISLRVNDSNFIGKNSEPESQSNADKYAQNNRLIGSVPYETSYSTHSPISLNSLRNLPNIPQMLKRYTKDDRCISNFTGNSCTLYQCKNFQITQMFNKFMSSEMHPSSTSSICPESVTVTNKTNSINNKSESKVADTKCKRKKISDPKQIYQIPCSTGVSSSVKTSFIPGSSFSFSGSTNTALTGGLYADNSDFTIEDCRNSTTNQVMAVNYMAAAVAHQQRNNVDANFDKFVKPAHQIPSHASSAFPFIGNSQVQAGYPFIAANPSSPLYHQYLQRHQEPFLGHTSAQIMTLYPPGYPTRLGGQQPYDMTNRPSWL